MVMVDILITNDDGVHSQGFKALKNTLNSIGNLLLIGPYEEKSWIGKAISRFKDVRLRKLKLTDGSEVFAVQGTPVDAILIGAFVISKKMPQLVVSGINTGANAGNAFILSSGTVGAAIEAALIGIPAMAVSVVPPFPGYEFKEKDFQFASQVAKEYAQRIIKHGLPSGIDLLNLNIPHNANSETELVITKVAQVHYGGLLEDCKGTNQFTFTTNFGMVKGANYDLEPGTDAYTVFSQHKISITPINIDLTGNLEVFRKWMKLDL